MHWFDFFARRKTRAASVVLIDIGTTHVAGAYLHAAPDVLPVVVYTKRAPIEARDGEGAREAMLRTLRELSQQLLKEGAPELTRVTGSGRAGLVLVSVDAPWQETRVRTERFEEKESFVFTPSMVNKRLETTHSDAEKTLVDESVVGSILNGYHTNAPYGKKVHRASIVVLSSLIERHTAAGIVSIVEQVFHTKNVFPIAGSSLRYQALRTVFPHEQNGIIIDATNTELSILSLVRKGLLIHVADVVPEHEEWIDAVLRVLGTISNQYPLPRTLFLLAPLERIEQLRLALAGSSLKSLWLSDKPPTIVALEQGALTPFVKQVGTSAADVVLFLMAIYYTTAHARREL